MKKIILLFLFLSVYIYSSCSCPSGTYEAISYTTDKTTEYITNGEIAANLDYYSNGDSCDKLGTSEVFNAWVEYNYYGFSKVEYCETRSYSYYGDYVFCSYHYLETNILCKDCEEEDKTFESPSDNTIIPTEISKMICPYVSDTLFEENEKAMALCDEQNGIFYDDYTLDCCTISKCYVPDNNTSEDNTTSEDNNFFCPLPLVKDTFSSTCSCPADTYLVTVDSEPRCLPNSDCTTNMHISDINNQCICNDGFVPDINLDCIPYVPDNNDTDDNTSANCAPGTYDCNGQCVLNGVTCYDSDYDENDGNSDNDPCSYPSTSSNDYSYQGNAANAEECQYYSLALGDGNSQYLKNEDCWFGVCYYNNSTNDNNSTPPPPIPVDMNGTITDGNSTQNIDLNISNIAIPLDGINTKLEDIKEVITNQSNRQHSDLINNGLAIRQGSNDITNAIDQQTTSLSAVLNSLNESQNDSRSQSANGISNAIGIQTNALGTKLDDILNELRESNDANSSNDINISLDLNETNDLLRDINGTLANALYPDSDSVDDAMNPFNDSFSGAKQAFSDSLTTFGNSKDSLIALANGATPPVITTGGSCGISFDWHGRSVDIDLSSVAPLAPYVQFVLNLYLLIITLRYYTIIARDIASYFFSGN